MRDRKAEKDSAGVCLCFLRFSLSLKSGAWVPARGEIYSVEVIARKGYTGRIFPRFTNKTSSTSTCGYYISFQGDCDQTEVCFQKGFWEDCYISRKECSFETGSYQLHKWDKRAMVTKNNNPLSIKGWMCSPQAVLRFGRLQRVLGDQCPGEQFQDILFFLSVFLPVLFLFFFPG